MTQARPCVEGVVLLKIEVMAGFGRKFASHLKQTPSWMFQEVSKSLVTGL